MRQSFAPEDCAGNVLRAEGDRFVLHPPAYTGLPVEPAEKSATDGVAQHAGGFCCPARMLKKPMPPQPVSNAGVLTPSAVVPLML